jgi:hypothetical protein
MEIVKNYEKFRVYFHDMKYMHGNTNVLFLDQCLPSSFSMNDGPHSTMHCGNENIKHVS